MYMFLLILVVIYVLLQFSCFKKEKKARNIFRNGSFPLIFAHRGSSHLFPENTELAFLKSFELGVDAFETDIRLTKDGRIVTQHNEDIDETTDGTGKVIDYTYDELKEIYDITGKINNLLKEKFDNIGITLVDFKIEFGKNSKGEILLADEITPDTCRLWDKKTGEKLDKDRFRRDLGNIEEAYIEVVKRLTEKK